MESPTQAMEGRTLARPHHCDALIVPLALVVCAVVSAPLGAQENDARANGTTTANGQRDSLQEFVERQRDQARDETNNRRPQRPTQPDAPQSNDGRNTGPDTPLPGRGAGDDRSNTSRNSNNTRESGNANGSGNTRKPLPLPDSEPDRGEANDDDSSNDVRNDAAAAGDANGSSNSDTPLPEVDSGSNNSDVGEESPSLLDGSGSWILDTLTALGVVIGLILLLRWIWTRMSGQPTARTPSSAVVEVLSRTSIAPRNHVLLLRIGPRILIVGDSGSGMRTLASVEDEQEVADLLAAVNASKEDSISDNFRQLLGRFGTGHDDPENGGRADWLVDDEDGRDDAEHLFDRARNNVSGLKSRLRNLSRRKEGGP